MAGAKNIYGEESEQSKERRGAVHKADVLAEKGSVAGKLKENRKYKQTCLDQIMAEAGMQTTRGNNPPQYGRSRMDEEGNQDTLK